MEKKDIMHLADLSRIRITEAEAESLKDEIASVLSYVSTVNDIAADAVTLKKAGVVRNVFREDVVTNKSDEYTDALLREAPSVKGRHVAVKKILQAD